MYKNICIFAIDNNIEVDEDDFIYNIRYSLFSCVMELLKKGVDVFWIKKESQFQKRLYWELKEVLCFAYPTVFIKAVGIDPLEHPSIADILTKGMFDDVSSLEESAYVISFYKDKDSSACAMVDIAKEDGKQVVDLMEKVEKHREIDEDVKYYLSCAQKSEILKRGYDSWKLL